jgi:hypothetical protein
MLEVLVQCNSHFNISSRTSWEQLHVYASRMRMCAHTHTYTYTHIHTYILTHTLTHSLAHAHAHTYIHIHTRSLVHAQAHTHTHTHTHTHMHTCRRMHKKLSAVSFTQDSKHALFADKFGDVGVAACGDPPQQPPSEQPELLLGHLCSIITSVSVSPDNR